MIDFDVAFDKLAGLETADEIADLFRQYGIKARRHKSRACAITRWMEDITGLDIATTEASVAIVRVPIGSTKESLDYSPVESRPTTDAMAMFIENFDMGDYPDLVEGLKVLCVCPYCKTP